MADAEPCNDLPEECWDLIWTKLDSHFDSLSLVSKRFYALTNALRLRLSLTDPIITGTISKLLHRFPNLVSLNLSHYRGDINAIFSLIRHRTLLNLLELDISHHFIPFDKSRDSGLGFRNLKVLKCKCLDDLGNSGLNTIAYSFPCLEELDISFPRSVYFNLMMRFEDLKRDDLIVTDDGIEVLSLSLKNLRKINLSGNEFITDRSIAALSNCLNLESILTVDCPLITANGIHLMLQNNAKMSSITVSGITFRNSNLIAEGFSTYGRALHMIDILWSIVSDECLHSFAKARLPLNRFSLEFCKGFTSNGLSVLLSAYPSLQCLGLERIDFLTDEIMKVLSLNLRCLVKIRLKGCSKLTISTLFALTRNCDLLEELDMQITGLGRTDDSLDGYKRSKVKSLNMSMNFKVTDKCLKRIAFVCPKLEKLDISSCSGVSKEGIASVLQNCPEIRILKIDKCSGIESIGKGSELPKLEVLSATSSGLIDSGLEEVGNRCSRLLKLVLEGCNGVTTSGVEEVAKNCKCLREINLCTNVSASVVERIVFSCPSLRRVTSPDSKLTENLKRLFLQHGCIVSGWPRHWACP